MEDKIYSGTNTKRESLLKKASDFKLDQKYSEGIEEKRIEFTKRFPLEKIKDMSIEDYVIGKQSKKSFSYWLEFGLKDVIFNIPGNASKFGLYYSGGSYCVGAGKNKRKLVEHEAINYFEKIINEITSSFDKVNSGDVINIPDNSLINNNVLQKILVIYFPQKFMSITSKEILVELISILFDEKKYVELVNTSPIFLNYICNKSLREMSIFKDWTYEKIGAFIWDTHKNNLSGIVRFIEGTPDEVKVVYAYLKESFSHRKIQLEILRKDAPTRGGGFLSMQILHNYEIFEEKKGILSQKSFNEEYSEAKGKYKDALDLLKKFCPEFSNEIISDIAPSYNNGHLPDDGDDECTSFPLNLILYGPPGTGKTYKTINKALEIIVEKEENSDVVDINKIKELLEESKISDLKKEERQTLQEAFKFFKEKGQIEFITFHQSYSYEDFVEGIKPIPPKEDENQSEEMVFRTQPGVFKSICEKAKIKRSVSYNFDENKIEFHKMSLGDTLADENDVFEYCIKEGVVALGYGEEIDYSKISSEKEIERVYSEKYPNLTSFGATAIIRFKNKIKKDDIIVISKGNRAIRAIGRVTGDYFYNENTPINFNHFRKVEWLYKEGEISVKQILNDKWLSQQSIYTFYNKDININGIRELISGEEKNKNFVLIIDEINRGNISKIFGELITLIEDDKRLGEENEMTVTLPYSKDSFGVPANLHIVGTMNTADRSIALMDMALRRRFSFQEMMPEYDVLNGVEVKKDGKVIKISDLLKKINERIEFLYDRDHTIGHAYFIKLKNNPDYKELCSIFANKIIPLLQEYFYEDWEKIQIVLGDHESQKNKKEKEYKMVLCDEKSETDVIGFNHPEIDDKRKIYSLNDALKKGGISPETFIKIYDESVSAKKSDEKQDGNQNQ